MPPLTPYYPLILAAYLLGSIPTGVVVARLFGGVDPRKTGSGNIGATNVGRSAGKAAGIVTLIGDALKGAAPALAALYLQPDPAFVSIVGFAAFAGHLFPVFLGFKGGKGVATACGVMLVVSPIATLIAIGVFVLLAAIGRYVSVASITAAIALPIILALLPGKAAFVPLGAAICVFIIIKHHENIKRLMQGRENKIGGKKG
ncbi:MAG: glycerol-3-phosphate 1-O-acyltransferase PlsY [Deltaproteobacteria bacterium]|nr:glycerol-3-phosphate 1-O-acyltransferase PlsY [Deltaproteobacteria bacterium]